MTRPRILLLAAALVAAGATAVLAGAASERFPHDKHARLFPLCIGCHGGIPTGDAAESFPDPAACVNCHDGERVERVEWTGPEHREGNLRFEHPEHAAEVAGEGPVLECSACHTREGAGRMEVERTIPERCFACHAHQAREHFVDARCEQCHVPLARTRFAAARIEALPEPSTHERPEFLAGGHGELARAETRSCATCHVRDQCAGCHVDAGRVEAIGALAAAPAGMHVRAIPAEYPLPPSHRDPRWIEAHGASAARESCGTCHTRESCATCHAADAPRAPAARIAVLPSRAESSAPGVATSRRAPASHASPFFATQHGAVAASRPESCTSCHVKARFCQSCHLSTLADARPARRTPGGGGAAASPPARIAEAAARVDAALLARFASMSGSASTGRAATDGSISIDRIVSTDGAASIDRAASRDGSTSIDRIASNDGTASIDRIASMGGSASIDRVGSVKRVGSADTVPERREPARPRRTGPGFHPTNYLYRHSAEAYNRRLDCSSCHDTRVFCRDCHEQAGFGTQGRLNQGFHDAEPVWLLRHGQAARQTLESCASCHGQRDCMQCHSESGSFRINPHGDGFDARRAQRRNARVCFACHLSDPLGRSAP